jgi:hypothetical protein
MWVGRGEEQEGWTRGGVEKSLKKEGRDCPTVFPPSTNKQQIFRYLRGKN